jgi:hypothetical protein
MEEEREIIGRYFWVEASFRVLAGHTSAPVYDISIKGRAVAATNKIKALDISMKALPQENVHHLYCQSRLELFPYRLSSP